LHFIQLKNKLRPAAERLDPDRRLRNIARNIRGGRSGAESALAGNDAIRSALSARANFLVGRVGASEMKIVNGYLLRRRLPFWTYNRSDRYEIQLNSGLYPAEDKDLDSFAELYLRCVAAVDIFCAWFIPGERRIINGQKFDCLTALPALEPYFFERPWSHSLRGKKVLVVTPFVKTIREQLNKLNLVWGYDLFPEVEFDFVPFPHSQMLMSDNGPRRPWVDILDEASTAINSRAFDVGLVGAGAATLPLACHMKCLGKVGIAMGGALQIMFGVRGRRWDVDPNFAKYFNEHWVRPFEEETPPRFKANENGAYW